MNVILESIRLQRATAAPNQPRLNEATSFCVIVPAPQLIALENRLEVLRLVGGYVEDYAV